MRVELMPGQSLWYNGGLLACYKWWQNYVEDRHIRYNTSLNDGDRVSEGGIFHKNSNTDMFVEFDGEEDFLAFKLRWL